jgi:hypothetical protein
VLAATAFLIVSCEENATTIGTALLPGKDFVNIKSTDTIGVTFYTQYLDSVISDNTTYSYLGRLSDPYFGNTVTDFVGQLRLLGKWPGGGIFDIDSVYLFFSIVGAKGTLNQSPMLTLYEITEQLNSNTVYYSNRDVHAGYEIGTVQMPEITKDTIVDFSMPLPKQFGYYLTRDTTKLFQLEDTALYPSDFRSFFKGIYVTLSNTTDPLLMALPFSSGEFYIRVYYSSYNGNNQTYDFVINAKSVRYNRYFHDCTTASPEKQIKHINDGVKDTLSYLQAFYGVFPRIKIPGLKIFRDSLPVSVNKARLIVPVFLDSDTYTTSTVPTAIYLSYTSTSGKRYILPDYVVNSSFFDGTFNSTKKSYTFNIASFVQEYLEGRIPNPEVEMYFPEGEYRNVILKTNNSSTPVKFEFTYTKF